MTEQVPTKSPFIWPVRVYWEDTDAGGIVFYANYLKYFERARTEWLRSLGIEQRALRDSCGGMFVVSDAQLRYHLPARLDDELLVTAQPLETKRVCITILQQAYLKTAVDAQLLCEATIRVGWIDAQTFKPVRIPPTILETLK
jgi:acyl-CoA thioester hydrolase